MSRQMKESAEQLRDTAVIAEEASLLFARWAAEEQAGYEGDISWEAFKKALNEERPAHSKPFPESSSS